MKNDIINKQLKQLRLSGVSQTLDLRLQEAMGNQLAHGQFLEILLSDELERRSLNKIERRKKEAQFRELKTLDGFDFSFNPKINRKAIYELATGAFIDRKEDILMVGPPGVGKSHLAQAIGYEAIKQNRTVYYRSIFDLLADLMNDETDESYTQILKRYLKPDLLIIDDMGIKQLPPKSGEYLFEIILRRYELKSTFMTSNRPIEDWGKLIGDIPTATAVLDRFLHHAKMMQIEGPSYRLADRIKNQKSA